MSLMGKVKAILEPFLPPIAVRGYQRMMRGNPPQPFAPVIARNEALKLRHRDRARCFILGNGPSLKKQDLRPLRDEVTFACNFFNLHPQCSDVAPRYYCFADPNAFFPGTFGETLEIDRASWYRDICAKVPHAEFLVPAAAKQQIEESQWFAGHPVWYVAGRESSCQLGRAESDLTRPMAQGQGTVAALAVPAAIFMGFREIYLLGCDCNWWVDHLVQADYHAEYVHFYDRNPYVRREATLSDFGLEQELLDLSRHFQSFRHLREHASAQGAQIFNATGGGILDVFPRVRLEEVLAAAASAAG